MFKILFCINANDRGTPYKCVAAIQPKIALMFGYVTNDI